MKTFKIALMLLVLVAASSTSQELDGWQPPGWHPELFDPNSPDAIFSILDLVIGGRDISFSAIERESLYDELDRLSDRDLTALVEGVAPESYSLNPIVSDTEENWRILVVAYASSLLVERNRSSDRQWELFLWALGLVMGIVGTLVAQYLGEKLKARA